MIRITGGGVGQPATSSSISHGGAPHSVIRQASTTAAGASTHSAEVVTEAGSAILKKTLWLRVKKATSGDLQRLIPFSVFIIVPFMGLLLPVALKLFPNILPFTFEDRFAEEEKKRELFKMRLEMAKFLQETVIQQPTAATTSTNSSSTATPTAAATERAEAIKEFKETFRKVRSTNAYDLPPTTAEMIRVTRLFGDGLTVDNLMRPQLLSMCRYMNLNAFGTDTFLRYQTRTSMSSIRKDDMASNLIMTEGVDSLTEPELHTACHSRGINTVYVSSDRLRTELNQWLELHFTYSIPATILILSRIFSYSDSHIPDRPGKVLHATLSSLPNTLLHNTELHHSEQVAAGPTASLAAVSTSAATPAVNPVLKRKVLQQQEQLIAHEKAQEEEIRQLCMKQAQEKEIELLERQRLAEEQSANAAPIFLGSSYSANDLNQSSTAATEPSPYSQSGQEQKPVVNVSSDSDQVVYKGPSLTTTQATRPTPKSYLTIQPLLELRKALLVMTSPSPVIDVRVKLEDLKEQQVQHPSSADTNSSATTTTAATTNVVDRLLGSRVEKMISKLDEEQAYESYSQEKFKPMATNERNELTVAEAEVAVKIIKHTPGDDATIRLIVQKLDIDGNGLVQLDHIFELADLVEQEEGTGGVIGDRVDVDGKRLKKTDVLKDHWTSFHSRN
ncbi:hypothetical protein BGW39_000643 [Mortierella sp. 14UC]|nr:hypothetical protein BGW39_000643 [Mortierella sp. 14UC]